MKEGSLIDYLVSKYGIIDEGDIVSSDDLEGDGEYVEE